MYCDEFELVKSKVKSNKIWLISPVKYDVLCFDDHLMAGLSVVKKHLQTTLHCITLHYIKGII